MSAPNSLGALTVAVSYGVRLINALKSGQVAIDGPAVEEVRQYLILTLGAHAPPAAEPDPALGPRPVLPPSSSPSSLSSSGKHYGNLVKGPWRKHDPTKGLAVALANVLDCLADLGNVSRPVADEARAALAAWQVPGERCDHCGRAVKRIISCPDGRQVCQECFDGVG